MFRQQQVYQWKTLVSTVFVFVFVFVFVIASYQKCSAYWFLVELQEVGDKTPVPQGSRIHFENVNEPTQAEKGMG